MIEKLTSENITAAVTVINRRYPIHDEYRMTGLLGDVIAERNERMLAGVAVVEEACTIVKKAQEEIQ